MSKLADLLVELGKHGDLYDAYQHDAEAVMRDYQLTGEETEAMLAKNVEKLKKLSGLDNLKSNDSVHAMDFYHAKNSGHDSHTLAEGHSLT